MRSRQAVKEDLYDLFVFDEARRKGGSFAELIERGRAVLPNFPFLLEDLFRYLYKEKPEFYPGTEILEEHLFQKEILEQLRPLLELLRPETSLDEEKALQATEALGWQLLHLIRRGGGMKGGEGEGEFAQKLAAIQTRAKNKEYALRALLKGAQLKVGGDPRSQEIGNLMKGLEAGFGQGQFLVDREEEFAQALRLTDELRRFARALGRIAATTFRQRLLRVFQEVEELYDVDQGRDLGRLLPYEKSKLAHPILRKIFWLHYLQERLLLYRLRARRPLGKGPKIFLVDLSASTHDGFGLRQGLEKLIAAALTLYSRKNAAFLVIYFQADYYQRGILGGAKSHFTFLPLHNPLTVEEWEDLATRFGKGGTDIMGPLTAAVEQIENDPRFARADVVLLTDGEAGINLEFDRWFKRQKERWGFSLTTILIDWEGSTKEVEVRKVSDRVWNVTEILPLAVLEEITQIYKKDKPETIPLPG